MSGAVGRRRFLHAFATFATGGPQLRAVEVIGMLPAGVEHVVVAMDGRTGCAARAPQGVSLRLCEAPGGGALRRIGRMVAVLRRERPDLLLTYNWGAIEWLLAARLAGLSAVVHHEDGFGPEEAERFLRRRVVARRVLLPAARALVVPSSTLRDVARDVWRQPDERVHWLPNGVDVERFAPAAPAERAGADRELVVGSVGGIRPEKNQALAVRAFARAPCRQRTRLVLVGDGPDLPAVRALAEELGVAGRVRLAGAVADTAPSYHEMDLFLISSRTEQMPIALLEAMASGLPVVGTDVGDVRRMVADENRALIVPPGDADALAQAIDAALGDAGLRARLGAQNRRRVETEFDRGRCYGRYVALYQRVAGTAGMAGVE